MSSPLNKGGEKMDNVAECMICRKKYDSREAYNHTLKTKHNRWKILLPQKKEVKNAKGS